MLHSLANSKTLILMVLANSKTIFAFKKTKDSQNYKKWFLLIVEVRRKKTFDYQ